MCFTTNANFFIYYTAPRDYISLNEDITFHPAANVQTECRMVVIIDDMVLEADEEFLILLETNDSRVSLTMDNATASVFITDNEQGTCLECSICFSSFVTVYNGYKF